MSKRAEDLFHARTFRNVIGGKRLTGGGTLRRASTTRARSSANNNGSGTHGFFDNGGTYTTLTLSPGSAATRRRLASAISARSLGFTWTTAPTQRG
jgi:hypothetical protein